MSKYHEYVEGSIEPLDEAVLVHNLEETGEQVRKGIIVLSDDQTQRGIKPRWAQVYAIGKNVYEVKVGEWILISHGRWTRGVKFKNNNEDVVIRMVDRNDIFLVADEIPETD